MIDAKNKKLHEIFFDLSFTRFMNEKELNSLGGQLSRVVGIVKKSKNPFALHFCQYDGPIKDIMDKMGTMSWPVYLHTEDISELSSLPENLFYLSPDAEETLGDFDEKTSFIIGGLVDRTITTNASLYKANSCKIKAVKLPLKDTKVFFVYIEIME